MTFTARFVVVVPAAGDHSEQRSPCVVRAGSIKCRAYGLHRHFHVGSNLPNKRLIFELRDDHVRLKRFPCDQGGASYPRCKPLCSLVGTDVSEVA
jgi:hypothetical protein